MGYRASDGKTYPFRESPKQYRDRKARGHEGEGGCRDGGFAEKTPVKWDTGTIIGVGLFSAAAVFAVTAIVGGLYVTFFPPKLPLIYKP